MSSLPSARELQLLIEGFEDQTLTGEEHDRFVALLEQSAAARAHYLEHVRLVGFLRHEARNRRILGKMSSLSGMTDTLARKKWALSGLAAAACLALLAGAAAIIRARSEVRVTFEPAPGTIWNVVHATGADRPADDALAVESRLVLTQGAVDLSLPREVRCLLSGPAELEIVNKSTVKLHRGSAWFRVGKEGHGFTVETPSFTAVDLGTEFGVHIADQKPGEMDSLHVETGKVRASLAGGASPILLQGGEAAAVKAGKWMRLTAAGGTFQKSLPSTLPYIRWSFDESAGGSFASDGNLPSAGDFPAVMRYLRDPLPVEKCHGPGRFGGGLTLHSLGDWAETGWPGISGNAPRSVALWIKIPKPADGLWGGLGGAPRRNVVSWGDWGTGDGAAWTLDFPRLSADDYAFFTRWDDLDAGVFSPAQVLDDRWHHLASVYSGTTGKDGTPEIVHYIDGVAHHAHYWRDRARSPAAVSTRTVAAGGQPLRFGIGAVKPTKRLPTMVGVIDEVYVFSGALTEAQVKLLYEENRVDNGKP